MWSGPKDVRAAREQRRLRFAPRRSALPLNVLAIHRGGRTLQHQQGQTGPSPSSAPVRAMSTRCTAHMLYLLYGSGLSLLWQTNKSSCEADKPVRSVLAYRRLSEKLPPQTAQNRSSAYRTSLPTFQGICHAPARFGFRRLGQCAGRPRNSPRDSSALPRNGRAGSCAPGRREG